jgi:glycosyltransferase involved in cell wall biosynthesis
MRVTHVITSLTTGGAQTALYRIISATRRDGLVHSVVSLTDEGTFGSRLATEGVPVTCLGMRPGVPDPRAVARLVGLLRREPPSLIQSWMYHANLVAGVAALLTRTPIVWSIRHSDVDPRHGKRLTHLTNTVCARLSGFIPARIVCCAESAAQSHRRLGYRANRLVVIPNGFDVGRFVKDQEAGFQVRAELSIPREAMVVGHLARFHPDKDHETMLAAAHLVIEARDAFFCLAGDDVEWSNPVLSARIDALGIRSRVRLLGARRDVPELLSAMDVLASSSRSEAFPQVLGEAMSCGVPCVATDCGDSREVVGPAGRIVPTRDPVALSRAILDLLGLTLDERAALGAAARARICERYELGVVGRQYESLYAEVASRGVARS